MVLDDMLAHDPHAHVAAETCAAGDTVMVFGEINSHDGHKPDVESVVRRAFRTVGYIDPSYGATADGVRVLDGMHAQSAEIDAAVGDADGAGDQGVMVGYATDATETMLPPETEFARQLPPACGRPGPTASDGSAPTARPRSRSAKTATRRPWTPSSSPPSTTPA